MWELSAYVCSSEDIVVSIALDHETGQNISSFVLVIVGRATIKAVYRKVKTLTIIKKLWEYWCFLYNKTLITKHCFTIYKSPVSSSGPIYPSICDNSSCFWLTVTLWPRTHEVTLAEGCCYLFLVIASFSAFPIALKPTLLD